MLEMISRSDAMQPSSRLVEAGATPPSRQPAGLADQATFGDVVKDMTASLNGRLQAAEQISIEALQGKAPVQDVVASVMQAEQSLQVALAIRDKIVQAFLEVNRTAI